ncbi:MAG: hypothetical protein HC896_03385 [Bacteroidales bacterium]|nr:hypothetical protein [Bacteroidales bacterium]
MLFVNGASKPLGRYPNDGYKVFTGASGRTQISDKSIKETDYPDNFWQGAECAVRTNRWILDPLEIESYSAGTFTFNENATYPLQSGFGYFLQNHPQTLDLEGEWCYYNNKIYLKSAADPNAQEIRASYHYTAVYILQKSSYTIENINFFGFNNYAIKGSFGSVKVNNCNFDWVGTHFVSMDGGDSTIVQNSTLTNSLNGGLILSSVEELGLVKNNQIENIGMYPGRNAPLNHAMTGVLVTAGEVVKSRGPMTVEGNTVINCGYVGIAYYHYYNIAIKNNLVDGACLVLDDGGGIYTWTEESAEREDRNMLVKDNIVKNVYGNSKGTNNPTSKGESYAYYVDDQSQGILIESNIALNSEYGYFVHNSANIDLANNVSMNCNQALLMVYYKSDYPIYGCEITGNTFVNLNVLSSEESQYSLRLFAGVGEYYIPAVNTFNNNSYINPFLLSGDYIYTFNGTDLRPYDFATWQTVDGVEPDGTAPDLFWDKETGVEKEDYVHFYYAHKQPVSVDLLGEFVDADGKSYSGSQTIPPYGYLLLFKKSNGTINNNLKVSGSKGICRPNGKARYKVENAGFSAYHWNMFPASAGEISYAGDSATLTLITDTSDVKVYVYGCKNNVCKDVSPAFVTKITDPPTASFTYHDVDKVVSFINTSANFDSALWEVDNGILLYDHHPLHDFLFDGYYPVTLTAFNQGCSSSFTDTVKAGSPNQQPGDKVPEPQDVDPYVLADVFTPNADGVNDFWEPASAFCRMPPCSDKTV